MKIKLATSLHLDQSVRRTNGSGFARCMQEFVPTGLLSLKAFVDRAGLDCTVDVTEVNRLVNGGLAPDLEDFHSRLARSICAEDVEFVGLMTDSDSLHHSVAVATEIKSAFPNTRVCLGGPAATPLAAKLLSRFECIDFVVRGEGEETLVDLLRCLGMNAPVFDVKGLTFRHDGKVVATADRAVLSTLDSLPVPAFEAYDMAGGAPLYLDVGRGCPFKCTFCSTAPFWKRTFRMKSIGRIIQEMALVRDRYGINHLNFSHDLFTGNMRWVERFCDALAAENLMMTWSCSTRTDLIDGKLLERMAGAGCVEIYYGIDSGSARIQSEIGKELDLHQAYNIVRTTRSCGIRPVTGFICGYPMERQEDFEATLRGYFETLRLGGFRAHLFTLCPYPEAPLYSADKISRRAHLPDLALTGSWAQRIEKLKTECFDIFSGIHRYGTPSLPEAYVDAAEELSQHLVVLKAIWPWLLPHYKSPMDWYDRWVEWIGAYNARNRPCSIFSHQGDARDMIVFLSAELDRVGLVDEPVADLVKYERAKMEARDLASMARRRTPDWDAFDDETAFHATEPFLMESFRYDLKSLLRHDSPSANPREHAVAFVKTPAGDIQTIQIGSVARCALEHMAEPRSVRELVGWLEIAHGIRMDVADCRRVVRTLSSFGLVQNAEVVAR